MTQIFISDIQNGLIGEISEYETIQEERNYYEVSKLLVRVVASPQNISLLKLGRLIIIGKDITYPYIIEHFSVIKEGKKEVVEVYALSLNSVLSYRTILVQETRSGNVEDVVKGFIDSNLINPADASRKIEGIVLGTNTGINENLRVSRTGSDLFDVSIGILKEFEATIDILYNNNNGTFYVRTWRGQDRSILQSINNHVIFSTEYDNLLSRNYYIDRLNFKNVSVVAGEGEGISRSLQVVGTASGLNRREKYVDARDLQSVSTDGQGNEVTLTPEEYTESLITRGIQSNNESQIIESFQATIDREQFIVGRDFGIGDKVTFQDTMIGVTQNLRVTKIVTNFNKDGITVVPSFGTNLPNNLLR